MAAERYDAFVSYGHGDEEWVHALAANLERLGLRVFLDAWELVAGDLIAVQLQRGLAAANAVVFVVSAESVGRGWVNEEFAAAVSRAASGGQRLIPVLAGEVALPPLVASRLYIDFRKIDGAAAYEAKVRELAAAIRGEPGRTRPGPGGTLVLPPTAYLRQGPAYLQQVRRIAPPEPPGLVGREPELAKLAAFCTEPDRGPYVWWQAGPWAGKSALLSTFVLHPPPGVRVVSFFITARLAAQDTREAFTQVLLEQLADLTGQELPAVLPEVTREAYLLELLAQTASTCQGAGDRLVLVVDGLDEDRGVTTGPDAHSIAGLLPASPSAGMRVVVAGRPNPPIPDDVPDWHPLRDEGIIRPLADSPYARDVRRLGRQELQRLLRGTATEQDLLGLLTAARGGLSGSDLEELTGTALWDIEQVLHTVAGRTFTRRINRWSPETEVYLLGHEELQTVASGYFSQRLATYHGRLHEWADSYRTRGWPAGTPEYLLSGYYRLLASLGDLPQMIACASDLARHDRMLDLTGGDSAALTEVRAALDLIAAQDDPDLASALRLAYHRNLLTDRNASLPTGLPAVWAALGQVSRAEALATSITDPYRQAVALVEVAAALAQAGQHQQAADVAQRAKQAARSTTDSYRQEEALARIAGALAEAGQHRRAKRLARSITEQEQRPEALGRIAGALAEAGQHQQAEQLVRSITYPYGQAVALARVAGALAAAGQYQKAADAARRAEQATHSFDILTSMRQRVAALVEVAAALAAAGQHQQATDVAQRAEQTARSGGLHPDQLPHALGWVAGALATAGQHQQAEQLARSITESDRRADALARVAGALAEAGRYQQAEQLARSITESHWRADALARVARALARAGQQRRASDVAERAEQAARSTTDPYQQADALARVAVALAGAGQHQLAASVAERAEETAHSITNPYWLAKVATALAGAGQHQLAADLAHRAEQAARSSVHPDLHPNALAQVEWALAEVARALARVAVALAEAGQHQQAEQAARSITDPYGQAVALARVAVALAGAGQHQQAADVAQQAEETARSITDPYWLAKVATALAGAGQHQLAADLAHRAEQAARSSVHPDLHPNALARVEWALAEVATALAGAGQHRQAEETARSITDPYRRAVALARVTVALAGAGQHQQAADVAQQAESAGRSLTDPYWRTEAMMEVATALAGAGQHQQAEQAACSITNPNKLAATLARVAGALAGAGQHQQAADVAQQAERAVHSITDPDLQADALAQLAEALTRTGNARLARHLAAVTCAVGRWTAAVSPILELDPSAFAMLERLLGDRQARRSVSAIDIRGHSHG